MMPVIFVGHGSPMNAVEDNEFTLGWKKIAESIPVPKVILSISAHWGTRGTRVSVVEQPETIHDFYGFPKELYDIEYKAAGSPEFAAKTIELLGKTAVEDRSWGLDHGTWSVLHVMYPDADIPVFQMSIDMNATPEELFAIGKKLSPLRESDVLIMGSGNIVHNLGRMEFSEMSGFSWAEIFDKFVYEKIQQLDFESVLSYQKMGEFASLSVPTTEHLYPLFYIMGAAEESDTIKTYNRKFMAGSLSMTSYVFS